MCSQIDKPARQILIRQCYIVYSQSLILETLSLIEHERVGCSQSFVTDWIGWIDLWMVTLWGHCLLGDDNDDEKLGIKDQGLKIKDQGLKIKDLGSRVKDQE